uniref:Uncharacterized protein n=1 Tax=Proboscia inermis TaxID=420281 RepID=A0A7S0CG02_9STRA
MTTPAKSFHDEQILSKNLSPHETELFHIKPVSINCPQYVGSSLHFTCGMEVESFEWTMGDCNDDVLGHVGCSVLIQLKTNYSRSGDIYVYLPRYTRRHLQKNNSLGITVNGKHGEASFIAHIPFKTNELKRSEKVTENADQFLSTIEADNNNVEDNPCFGGCVVRINVAISPNEDSTITDGDSCNIKAGEIRIKY